MSDSETSDYDSSSGITSIDDSSGEREMADFVVDDYESSGDEPDEEVLTPDPKDKEGRKAHKAKIQKLADERDADHVKELEKNKEKYIVREKRPRRAKRSATQQFEEWQSQLEELDMELKDVKDELVPLKKKRKKTEEEKEIFEDLIEHKEILTDRIRILQENITSVEEANKTVWGDLEKMKNTAERDRKAYEKRVDELELMQAEYENTSTVTLKNKIKKAEADIEKLKRRADKSHMKYVKAEEDQKILTGELDDDSSGEEEFVDSDDASDWEPSEESQSDEYDSESDYTSSDYD